MNKYQEALNRLKIKSLYYADTLVMSKADLVEVAINQDKKTLQELVGWRKPKKVEKFLKDQYFICPSCFTKVWDNTNVRYCSACGQALEWEENE